MPCYHPITAYRSSAGRAPNGKWPLVFKAGEGYQDMPVTIPCGSCIGCRLERSRQWAIRCLHEASLYDRNCYVTLTYNNESLPKAINVETGEIAAGFATLYPRHMTLFLKRLRKEFGSGIRFFQCGEYGERRSRPHHHIILFNFDFPDKVFHSMSDTGFPQYRSAILSDGDDRMEALWPHGHALIGGVTFESAAYVARYITKKLLGKGAKEKYASVDLVPEYTTMSRRPGIAHNWFLKFSSDIYPSDECVVRKDLICRPPKYYDRMFELTNPVEFSKIKLRRVGAAKRSVDNGFERLSVRERVQKLRSSKLIRPLEIL
nr:MAG: replication initiator protein [Microvirus sp.]